MQNKMVLKSSQEIFVRHTNFCETWRINEQFENKTKWLGYAVKSLYVHFSNQRKLHVM
jgi:hypothetical protein